MFVRIGSGLPSTVTPGRVLATLKLANSHERLLKDELDGVGTASWTETDGDADLYERLVALLATPGGRDAYDEARSRFEGKKARLQGRADFFVRLVDSCRTEAFGSLPPASDEPSDLIERLAEEEAWGFVAEVSWARAVRSGDAGPLLETVDQHPETRRFLETVLDGVVREAGEPAAAEGATVDELIRGLRTSVQRLEGARLEERELQAIGDYVRRLMEVVEADKLRANAIDLKRDELEAWKARHQPHSSDLPTVAEKLAVLEDQIGRDEVTAADVDQILDLLAQLIAVHERHVQAREEVQRALRAGRPLTEAANTADSLGGKLEELEAAIDVQLLPAEPSDMRDESSHAVDLDEPEAGERETGQVKGDETATQRGAPDDPDTGTPQIDGLSGSTRTQSKDIDDLGIEASSSAVVTTAGPRTATGGDSGNGIDERGMEAVDAHDCEASAGPAHHVAMTVDDQIATALNHGRLGLAYHLANSSPDAQLSADLVRLVASNYATDDLARVGADIHGVADRLSAETTLHEDTGNGEGWSRDVTVLASCAALDPALVAPGGPVGQLLEELTRRLADSPSLRLIAKAASDVSITGVHLPRSLLRDDADDSKWQDAVAGLRSETLSWMAGERQANLRYRAATRLWRRLLEDWGSDADRVSLGRMFRLVDKPADKIDTSGLAQAAEYWRANRDKEIDRIDRELRGSEALSKIVGSARTALRAKIDHALAFADRWVSLMGERPAIQSPFHAEQAHRLREAVVKHLTPALAETRGTAVEAASAALLKRYGALFHDATEPNGESVGLNEILHGDLLANPDIAFNDEGRPAETPLPADVLRSLLETPLDFARAAVDRARRGDLVNAAAAIRFAERTGLIDLEQADRARTSIDEHRARLERTLAEQLGETRIRLDAAYANGSLTWESYDEKSAEISDLAPADGSFVGQLEVLKEVDEAIDSAESSRRDAIRRRIAGITLSEDSKSRIDSVVDAGQLQIAEDFLERLEQGEDLPAVEDQRDLPFDRFFPSFVEEFSVSAHRDEDGIGQMRQAMGDREPNRLIDAHALSEDALRDGIALLDAWVALQDNPTSARLLQHLTAALGFERAVVRVSRAAAATPSGQPVFELDAAPISDGETARLPDFGSRANGKYRLMTLRGRATAEAVVREIDGPASSGLPNIVVFVGVLDVEARRALAREFGSGGFHATLVLDEALIAFLSSWPSSRLAAFFDCASAFAFSQPYDPDAPLLAPEMFYGRKAARDAIVAMSGDLTHFVYGGRRLGKTTLLADIAREYGARAAGEPEELVLLVNLKGSGIGENQPTEGLWALFGRRLAEHQVLQPGTVRQDSITRGVEQWLAEADGRRILLLMDESDAFLEAERRPEQGYRVLDGIKVLMETTQRRFKVVFAGLHNVQRAAKDPNTPFAHLGEAVQIGPMLPGVDGDEIQRLIRNPLEALGYRFVSNDSIIRIAAETNYYPALAQQFCKELLTTMRQTADTSLEQGPPFPIHPDMVDRVFNARETRNRVRNLFAWTIQLDPRYEFLTYLIAQRSFDLENGRPRAMRIADIREAALREWPKGFAHDSSFWMFEVLLDEMVGLGILRESFDRFAIRTRNLRMLLGNDEEIERRLADASRLRAPPVFDPPEFRYTLDDGTPSSLSADQEKRLFSRRYSVGIVFGTRVAGLDRVSESIRKAAEAGDGSLLFSGDLTAPAQLPNTLRQVSRGRRPGTEVVLVDMRATWDEEAFGIALSSVAGQEGQTRVVRPVFLCGPSVAWSRRSAESGKGGGSAVGEVWLGPCARDFTRIRLTARESHAKGSFESHANSVDLPWPATLAAAFKNKELESIEEVVEACLEDNPDDLDVSDILISEDARIVFRILSDLGGDAVTADDLAGFVADEGANMAAEDTLRLCLWGERLGVLLRRGKSYRLDTTYAMGLARAFGE